MYYFGTNLTEHGHYTWDLSGDRMINIGLLPKNTPFNPEELINNNKHASKIIDEMKFVVNWIMY